MKSLLNAILKVFRSKTIDLDNDGKVEELHQEIAGLFTQFKTMSDKIEEANGKLIDVIQDEGKKQDTEKARLERLLEEHERKMEDSKVTAEKAQNEIEKNNKVKAKVDEFTI